MTSYEAVFLSNVEIYRNKRAKRIKALENQNWECSICRKKLTGDKNSHWDHDHKTGKFRAVLCHQCNTGLGMYKDNPDLLRRAALYLELHS